MTLYHTPVLIAETMHQLQIKPGFVVADLTCGGGGHLKVMAEALNGVGTVVAIDQDPNALAYAQEVMAEVAGVDVRWVRRNFRYLEAILDEQAIQLVDTVLIDCGISSRQVDDPTRGFSLMADGPLRMTMDPDSLLTAEEVVNEWSEEDLSRGLFEATGDRFSRAVARKIVQARGVKRIQTTFELARVVESALPRSERSSDRHPATVAFMGIRSLVNDEIRSLDQGITAVLARLRCGGRMVIITFNSSELSQVRRRLHWAAGRCQCPPGIVECRCGTQKLVTMLTRKPVAPTMEELSINPRARSARLLAVERTALPVTPL